MKLTKRLNTIVSLIDDKTTVYDIGCDHALIDIYLTLNKKNNCVAIDVNNNALESAKNNIKKYNLENDIKTIISDGLSNVFIDENNTIVICGMGANTILNIIKKSEYKKIDNLIIQSNNDLYNIRKKINKLGFFIDIEVNIKDKSKYYTIIKFKKGYKKYNYFDYKCGINFDNKEYIKYLISKNNIIYNKIPNKYIIKKIKIKIENNYLNKKI